MLFSVELDPLPWIVLLLGSNEDRRGHFAECALFLWLAKETLKYFQT